MAKLTFDNVLTKLSNMFKKDVYIIQNRYCLGGDESEAENISRYFCILSQESMDLVKEVFPDDDIIYFSNIKNAKKDLNKYVTNIIPDNKKKELIDLRDKLEKDILSIDKWKSFDFTDEEAHSLFDDAKTMELFVDDKNIPSVTISKTLFPLIKFKDVRTLYYSVSIPECDDDLITFYIGYDAQWFQTYNIVQYVDLY